MDGGAAEYRGVASLLDLTGPPLNLFGKQQQNGRQKLEGV